MPARAIVRARRRPAISMPEQAGGVAAEDGAALGVVEAGAGSMSRPGRFAHIGGIVGATRM